MPRPTRYNDCSGSLIFTSHQESCRMCVQVPCANCNKTYVGETGRKLVVRLHKHKTEVESKTKRAFARSQRTVSLTEYSKSALNDHANQANHTIDWKKQRSSTENKSVLLSGLRKL